MSASSAHFEIRENNQSLYSAPASYIASGSLAFKFPSHSIDYLYYIFVSYRLAFVIEITELKEDFHNAFSIQGKRISA